MRVSFSAKRMSVRAKEPSWDGSACSVKVQGLFASMGKSKKAYGGWKSHRPDLHLCKGEIRSS